jgi:hypothetical protein
MASCGVNHSVSHCRWRYQKSPAASHGLPAIDVPKVVDLHLHEPG